MGVEHLARLDALLDLDLLQKQCVVYALHLKGSNTESTAFGESSAAVQTFGRLIFSIAATATGGKLVRVRKDGVQRRDLC